MEGYLSTTVQGSTLKQKMINGLSMEIGDERGTRFWEDVWLRGGTLKDHFSKALLSFKPKRIRHKGLWVLGRVRVEMELPTEERAIQMGVGFRLSEPVARNFKTGQTCL